MEKLQKGLLITAEGIDGSGKSVLCKGLEQELSQSYEVLLTKEPGDTPLGKGLRTTLLQKDVPVCDKAEFLLFATDRAQHFCQVVLPALSKNKIVISDRMADSSLVYQGYGRNLDLEMLTTINEWAMNNRQPDLVFYLKIDAQKAYQRMAERNVPLNSFEKEVAFMHKLSEGFDTLVAPRKNVITLDALQSPETLVNQAVAALKNVIET